MVFFPKVQTIFAIGALVFLAACQTTAKPSGFLTSYEGFRAGVDGGADQVWAAPEIKSAEDFSAVISRYNKVIIDPIWISMGSTEAYDGVQPVQLQALADLFHREIYNAIKHRFKVVQESGPGVMRLSYALTGVESPNRVLAATSTFMPIGLGISTVSRVITGEHTNVGSASTEMIATDSVTNKALFAAMDRRPGSKDLKKLVDPLSDAKEAFKWWANRLLFAMESPHLLEKQ